MTATTYSDYSGDDDFVGADALTDADRASRRWRAIWRVHFYSGVLSAPFVLLMAFTGLVILYTQPIRDWTQGDVRTVSDTGDWVSFDRQEQAAEAAFPDVPVVSMTVPRSNEVSTAFGLDNGREVFVNPYTAKVLGSSNPDGGIVGLANRIHGSFNNDRLTVSLPTVSAIFDDGPVMRDYVVGDLLVEILGCWGIVLAASGLYLWWPRGSKVARARNGRGWFKIRIAKEGRARWRDLHAVPGVVLVGLLAFQLMSGMPWSSYWGPNFTAVANEVSPNVWTDAPASGIATRGDLDRLGGQIHWNTGDIPIPASYAAEADGTTAAPISLDSVVKISTDEGMKPGYTVFFPANTVDDAGNPLYGSFTLSNSWPRKTGEARDVFLDQFSGQSLAEQTAYGYGNVSYAADALVSTHMGTQLGVVNRIFMTLLCVLTIWAVISAVVMYWKRRRPGTAGLPRRPRDVKLNRGLWVIIGVVAIIFPLWGVTAALILLFDRFVIRNVPRLRVAFGQR
jgi:uncharacterized iron-regulated membrane protein